MTTRIDIFSHKGFERIGRLKITNEEISPIEIDRRIIAKGYGEDILVNRFLKSLRDFPDRTEVCLRDDDSYVKIGKLRRLRSNPEKATTVVGGGKIILRKPGEGVFFSTGYVGIVDGMLISRKK